MSNTSGVIRLTPNGALGATFERVAAAAISPGHIMELTTLNKFQVHATAGGNMIPFVALEDVLQGTGVTTAYEAADQVRAFVPRPGDVFYARLADGETAVIGSELESAGDGTLQVHVADSGSGAILGEQAKLVALEAVDMSGSSGADPDGFIKVMRV